MGLMCFGVMIFDIKKFWVSFVFVYGLSFVVDQVCVNYLLFGVKDV